MFCYCTALLVYIYIVTLYVMVHLNVRNDNDDVKAKAYVTKPALVITRVHMLHFTRHKNTLQRRSMILRSFVPTLLGYTHANNYSDIERFDKVIAKIKWCVFCLTVYILSKAVSLCINHGGTCHNRYTDY